VSATNLEGYDLLNTIKAMLMSMGVGVASAKVAYAISTFELDDALRPLGLARRHSEWPAKLAFLGVGIVIGGLGSLLVARTNGSSTREKIAGKTRVPRGSASNESCTPGEVPSDGVNGANPGLEANQTPSG
jgi:hypothetical protein